MSLERVGDKDGGDATEAEEGSIDFTLKLDDSAPHLELLADRQLMTSISTRPPPVNQQAFVEITCAKGHKDGGGSLSIQYEVMLPADWSVMPRKDEADLSAVDSPPIISGSTHQSSCQDGDNDMPYLSNATCFSLGSTVILIASYLMQAMVKMHRSIIISVVVSLVLLIASAVRLRYSPPATLVHYYSHPIILVSPRDRSYTLEEGSGADSPVILLQVCATRANGVVTVVAYGYLRVPGEPGVYDMDIPTWKVMSDGSITELGFKLRDYYLGTAIEFDDMKQLLLRVPSPNAEEIASPEEDSSNLELVTAKVGSIQVRTNVASGCGSVVSRRRREIASSLRSGRVRVSKTKPPPNSLRESIDDVLRRVKSNRRERLLRDVYVDGVSPLDAEGAGAEESSDVDEVDRKRTKALLERISKRGGDGPPKSA